MKSKNTIRIQPLDYVTLDELEAWLSCRLCWKWSHEQPPDAEPPPWEHLQRCIRESVFFFHREQVRLGKVHYASVQEFFWECFERQSLEASKKYAHPWERAKDMRFGESVLEQYVRIADGEDTATPSQHCIWSLKVPGFKLALQVRADLMYPRLRPVLIRVVQTAPDPELALFHLAPWAAAITAALERQQGCPPKQMEAMFLIARESPQVVRLLIPAPAPETLNKLHLWLRAFTCGLARNEVFPMPGSHCSRCPFREPCARWPVKAK